MSEKSTRWLTEYARLRRQRLGQSKATARAADLVTLLLKKRLFSSPAAFAQTIAVHRESIRGKAAQSRIPSDVPAWLENLLDDGTLDDDALAETENDSLTRSARLQPPPTSGELELLDRMERWALRHEARADAKAKALLTYLTAICKPDGKHWTNERVVVFTEYRDTQRWLAALLQQAGLGDAHLALLHGGMPVDEREELREAFQASPDEHPVRILLATDAASEGIDLQRHCHRLVNYDIPFNPNKLEQRIGRIDRYGQRHVAEIRHFVGSGLERARPGSYEDDLEFLSRVAVKVARMEADLGAVNAVLAAAVQDKLLGRLRREFDVDRATEAEAKRKRRAGGRSLPPSPLKATSATRSAGCAPSLTSPSRNCTSLPATWNAWSPLPSIWTASFRWSLILTRSNSRRGFCESRPSPVRGHERPRGLPFKLKEKAGIQRPITFDAAVADGRDDVVLAHLGHPLTAMATSLLRAAMWGSRRDLHRVTALVSDDLTWKRRCSRPSLGSCSSATTAPNCTRRSSTRAGGCAGRRPREHRAVHPDRWCGTARQHPGPGTRRGQHARASEVGAVAAGRGLAGRPRRAAGRYRSAAAHEARVTHQRARPPPRRGDQRISANLARFAASLRTALAADEPDDGQMFLPIPELDQRRSDRVAWQRRLAEHRCRT